MPLGQEIGAMVEAVRDRVEVAEHDGTWHVTAGSFDGALAYARERFDAPVVLARRDRGRWWPRVTLVVTDDPSYAASAPPLAELADPAPPAASGVEQAVGPATAEPVDDGEDSGMPRALEAMFARQEGRTAPGHRIPHPRRRS